MYLRSPTPQKTDDQDPPRACRTPQPVPLIRRHSSNYLMALRRHSSSESKDSSLKSPSDEVDPLDSSAAHHRQQQQQQHAPAHKAAKETKGEETVAGSPSFNIETPAYYNPEDTKRLLQRKSIALDMAKSQEEFGVKYGGVRRNSGELKEEEERAKQLHKEALKELKTHKHDQKDGHCFHSNQSGPNYPEDVRGYYPETFEYADFKRRMSFHN